MYIIIIAMIVLVLALEYIILGKCFWFTEIIFYNPHSKKLVLTFDDGPHPIYTREVMGILRKYNLPATFFVCGKESELHPEIIKELIEVGHEIGNHSWNHKNMIFKTPKKIRKELARTDQLLRNLGVKGDIHFRPPFTRFFIVTPLIAATMKKKLFLWNIPSKDYRSKSVDEIVGRILKRVKKGGIIVMHDGRADRSLSVQALERLLPILIQRGFEFTTCSEYLR